jgi:hypothetical protein
LISGFYFSPFSPICSYIVWKEYLKNKHKIAEIVQLWELGWKCSFSNHLIVKKIYIYNSKNKMRILSKFAAWLAQQLGH